MKNKMCRLLAVVMSLILMTSVLSACGGNKETASDGQVTLKWILGGYGELADSEEVWAEFNKRLPEYLPNTQVEFEVIPFADMAEKWKLISASRETVDIIWAGWMLNLDEEARKGSLRAMDDLLQYAPDLVNEVPDSVLGRARVKGKLYAVPNYQIMTSLPYGVKTQQALADEFGLDADEVIKTFDKTEPITKDDFKIFEDYLEKLKAAGKLGKGVSKTFLDQIMGQLKHFGPNGERITANAYVNVMDSEIKVYDFLTDFPNNMDYFDLVREWYEKGYIRKDIISVQDHAADEDKQEDGYVLWSSSCFEGESRRASDKAGFPILAIPVFDDVSIPHTRPTANTAISSTTVDAERAMKLIDLMNTKKGSELYNLLTYGIEGKHYNKVNDKEIEWLLPEAPASSGEAAYGYQPWVVGNIFNGYTTQYDTPGWNDYILNEVNAKATPSPLIGFSLDLQPIKLELAQYDAIWKEYLYLDLGATANYEELIAERDAKLKNAGSDKIVEEVRRQIEEWEKIK